MLQTIREHTQGWIAGIIISIIIFTFAFWGIHSYFTGGVSNNVVAKVNGVEITRQQLTNAYERMRRQSQTQYGSVKDQAALKNRALAFLIEVETLKQAAINQGFYVSDRELDSFLQSMPEFQVDGRFSVERFQEFLASAMLSTSEFFDLIRTSLLVDQPKLGIIFTSYALPDETNNTISLVNQERDISYANLPLQYFLSQQIVISSEKIKAYYEQHQTEFMTPEQVSIEYVELSLNDLAAKMTPTDEMLKNFYNENINSYTQPRSWNLMMLEIPSSSQDENSEEFKQTELKAKDAAKALTKGEDFTKIAKQYNATITTQNNITLSQMTPELQKTVGDLNRPQQLSEPIKTSKGFMIIKVLDITEPKIQAFESVKNKIKETYIRQHAEEKFADVREQLANLTYEHPDSLQIASTNLNLPIKTSELFGKENGGKDISQYKKVRDTAFSNDVLNLQNNSDVIQINPETVIVLRVKSHVPSKLLALSDVSKQIEDKLKTTDAETRAKAMAEELRKKLQEGADLSAISNQYKLTWEKKGLIGRYSKQVDPAILDAAFSLPNPATNGGKPIFGITRLTNGYAIIALNAVKDGNITDQKQKAVFAEQVQNSEGMLEYQLYKLSVSNNTKIKIES